jgi:hypothetical protein
MRTVKWNLLLSGVVGMVALGVVTSGVQADVTSEKAASILIFPAVTTADQFGTASDTVIQIANTSNSMVHAHCNYVDASRSDIITGAPCDLPSPSCVAAWQETDFDIWLTKQQPTHWVVSTGRRVDPRDGFNNDGSGFDPGHIPPMANFEGELKCVEVTASGEPVAGNHLKGEAEIVLPDEGSGDIAKYNAIGIEANPDATPANPLLLDGNVYNACPAKLWLNHAADESDTITDIGALVQNRVGAVLVPCSEDFENQIPKSVTVQFKVYNEFEEVFSASTTVTCFLKTILSDIDSPSNNASSVFNENVLGSSYAMSVITPVTQPDGSSGGVVGVGLHAIFNGGDVALAASSIHGTGDLVPAAGPDSIYLAPRE